MKNTKITFSMKRNLMLCLLSVFGLSIAQMATASTVVYYRMEDGAALLTDYSGNGNTATTSVASIVDIPATGDGSAFSDPIPQTGDSNSKMGYFNGTKHAQVADPFGDSGLTDFTAEG